MVDLSSSSLLSFQRFRSIETLLVDCKILSFQLRSSEPYLWAVQELSGYSSHQALPFYRLFPCHSVGLFKNKRTGLYHEERISTCILDEKDQCEMCFYQARMPLADYFRGDLNEQESLWSRALVEYYKDELLEGHICQHAWLEFSEDLALHLLAGARHVLSSYLFQVAALLAQGQQSKEKSWRSAHALAHPKGVRSDLGW